MRARGSCRCVVKVWDTCDAHEVAIAGGAGGVGAQRSAHGLGTAADGAVPQRRGSGAWALATGPHCGNGCGGAWWRSRRHSGGRSSGSSCLVGGRKEAGGEGSTAAVGCVAGCADTVGKRSIESHVGCLLACMARERGQLCEGARGRAHSACIARHALGWYARGRFCAWRHRYCRAVGCRRDVHCVQSF